MKKILVPTDFSDYADNALKHAIAMAKTTKASIHLCYAIAIPEVSPMAGMVVWPVADYAQIKENADLLLQKYLAKISATHDILGITYSSEMGSVQQMVENLSTKLRVDLVVMGMAGAGKLAHFILGSNSWQVIATCKVAVMVVPKQAVFSGFKKIAFATDLADSDLNAIQQLAHLFYAFNTDILITYVNENKESKHQIEIDNFINEVICKINYSKIYFKKVAQNDIDKGLSWVTKNTHTAMLAMVHKHINLFKRIIKGSHTKNITSHIEIPLLVLPENKTQIGW